VNSEVNVSEGCDAVLIIEEKGELVSEKPTSSQTGRRNGTSMKTFCYYPERRPLTVRFCSGGGPHLHCLSDSRSDRRSHIGNEAVGKISDGLTVIESQKRAYTLVAS
jgi:hypothetical protein